MLRVINLLLLLVLIVSSFILVSRRYQSRLHYQTLSKLRVQADTLNKEYSRLQIEEGTYSSNFVLQDVALHRLGLVAPDKNNLLEIK